MATPISIVVKQEQEDEEVISMSVKPAELEEFKGDGDLADDEEDHEAMKQMWHKKDVPTAVIVR